MTNAELAILGLIIERPRHGYEIDQVIKERGMRDWSEIGFSSIYYLLKKLERDGQIESRLEEAERGPARKVYHSTQAGQLALRAGILEALRIPGRYQSRLQLGLAYLPNIPPAEALNALRQYREALVTQLDQLQEKWRSQHPTPFFVDAMFEHSLTMIRAEIGWVEGFTDTMEEEHDQN